MKKRGLKSAGTNVVYIIRNLKISNEGDKKFDCFIIQHYGGQLLKRTLMQL